MMFLPHMCAQLLLLASVAIRAVSDGLLCPLSDKRAPPAFLVHSFRKIRPDLPAFDPCGWRDEELDEDGVFRLSAARNEYESVQVVVNPSEDAQTIDAVRVVFDISPDLSSSCSIQTLVHRVGYLNITTVSDCSGAQGRWPDPLIPERDVWFGERRNALPVELGKDSPIVFWIDLYVPDGGDGESKCAPGEFSAQVEVDFLHGDSLVLPFRLELFGFSLASTSSSYRTSYGLSPVGIVMAKYGEREWKDIYDSNPEEVARLAQMYIDLGLMHRVSLTHGGGAADVAVHRNAQNGSYEVDWESFDARWGDLLMGSGSERLGRALPFGPQRGVTVTSFEVPLGEPKDGAFPLPALFYEHARERGWDLSKLVSKVCDEPASRERWRECARNCAGAKNSTPSARCEVTASIDQLLQDPNNREEPDVADSSGSGLVLSPNSVSILTALVNFMESSKSACPDYPPWSLDRDTRPDYDEWLTGGKHRELWLYQSCMSEGCSPGINLSDGCQPSNTCRRGWPSFMIDTPILSNRVLPWVAMMYNASGELYWHTNYADTCTRANVVGNCPVHQLDPDAWGMDAWTNQLIQGGNGDGQLTYPGHTRHIGGSSFVPIASLRLKAIRDGLEDREYLQELPRERALHFTRQIAPKAYAHSLEPRAWRQVRRQMGQERGAQSAAMLIVA